MTFALIAGLISAAVIIFIFACIIVGANADPLSQFDDDEHALFTGADNAQHRSVG